MEDLFDSDNIPQFSDAPDDKESISVLMPERYTNIQHLEKVGSVLVSSAFDNKLGLPVKIWLLSEYTELDDKRKQRVEALASLAHKNLISITDYDLSFPIYWVEEQNTHSKLRNKISKLTAKNLKNILLQLFDFISYINEHTAIGQLSIDDIFLDENLDVRVSFQSNILSVVTGAKFGIVAPEQKSTRNYQSKAADQYVTGSLIEHIISGNTYRNKKRVNEILSKATNADPFKRFTDLNAFKLAFTEQFKVSWLEQLITGKLILFICSIMIGAFLFSSNFSFITKSLSEFVPVSKVEIAKLSQEANTLSLTLLSRISEYQAMRNNLIKEQENIRANSNYNKKHALRQTAIKRTLKIMEDIFPSEHISLLNSQIRGVETLIKGGEFKLAISQLKSIEPIVEQVYLIALHAPEILEGLANIEKLIVENDQYRDEIEITQKINKIHDSIEDNIFTYEIKEHVTAIISDIQKRNEDNKKVRLNNLIVEIESSMVHVAGGRFKMGIQKSGMVDARPPRQVVISEFNVSRYELTYGIYNKYRVARGLSVIERDSQDPVVGISWLAAQEFISWLNQHSGHQYRLLTEAEWEFLATSSHNTLFSWGNSLGKDHAVCASCLSDQIPVKASIVGKFKANPLGLFDLNGNVWEWVQDCYFNSYVGAPSDGSAVEFEDCQRRVIRGGAWNSSSNDLHPSYRNAAKPDFESGSIGVRLAR